MSAREATMRFILDWHSRASTGTLATARHSQEVVIEAVDRLVQLTSERPTVNRVLNMQLDVVDAVLGRSPQLVEQSYEALQHLVAQNRDFARRLLQAIDQRDDVMLDEVTGDEPLATVHRLPTGDPAR
jgi:hypothetical protein